MSNSKKTSSKQASSSKKQKKKNKYSGVATYRGKVVMKENNFSAANPQAAAKLVFKRFCAKRKSKCEDNVRIVIRKENCTACDRAYDVRHVKTDKSYSPAGSKVKLTHTIQALAVGKHARKDLRKVPSAKKVSKKASKKTNKKTSKKGSKKGSAKKGSSVKNESNKASPKRKKVSKK